MSPSSYQTAPPRNNKGANYRGGERKGQYYENLEKLPKKKKING